MPKALLLSGTDLGGTSTATIQDSVHYPAQNLVTAPSTQEILKTCWKKRISILGQET